MSGAAYRPLVGVYNDKNEKTKVHVKLPAVFRAPIRSDVVNFVHTNMAKNKRHPYAVSRKAGHQTSAESWGTGRAVARIPRVRGGGTHRSGQGAFGNMCRGGRRFAPTRVWRKWHRKVNINQRRYALVSAIAASGVPALVLSKGHRIEEVPEFPLVVSDKVQEYKKTKEAVKFLKSVKAWNDIERVYKSKGFRAGRGKMRNRRRTHALGPVVIYGRDSGLTRAFRNIPGIETINVEKLNLLRLAPGGHLGRFVIWTESAFRKLDQIYGTWKSESLKKRHYNLPQPKMANSDLTRILQSDEIRKVLRKRCRRPAHARLKKNPLKLKNLKLMLKLNPYALILKKRARLTGLQRCAARKLLSRRRSGKTVDGTKVAKALKVLHRKNLTSKQWAAEKAAEKEEKGGVKKPEGRIEKAAARKAARKEAAKKKKGPALTAPNAGGVKNPEARKEKAVARKAARKEAAKKKALALTAKTPAKK
ncbi:60S ribosomal protein L4 [Halotydeus destructor]|nr:60S ribosomal protein L4 [Halotydeus destructor]